MRKLLLLSLLSFNAWALDNTINIDQVGSSNTISVTQEGSGHSADIKLGKSSASDNNNINIEQRDIGAKTANVEITGGINNGIDILQQGAGAHITNVQNLLGSGNSITIGQNGDANHTFNLIGTNSNIGNTINATQSGSADKTFTLNLTGTAGATVNVEQTNPSTADTGSMSINCLVNCGTYNYIRN